MNNTKDMTNGVIWKTILFFAIPVFISNLFQQLYNSIDSLIVGHYLGTNALAAVSSSGSLIFLFTSFFTGMATGAGVVIAKYFGQKNYDDMQKAIHTTIAFGFVASIFLTIIGILITPTILKWMKTDSSVLPSSIEYFRIYFCGVTGVIMYNIFSSTLQAIGNSRRPLFYLVFSSCLNIVLDLVFVGGLKMGVGAAALGTAISQFCSALLCFLFLIRKGTIYQVRLSYIRFHKGMLSLIMKYGIPSGIQNSVIGLANVVVQSNINSFGATAMAGCGAYSKIEGFVFLPITSFSLAMTTFIGQNLGAQQYERAKKGSRFGILTALVMAEVLGVLMYIFAPQLVGLFAGGEKSVIDIGVMQFRTEAVFYFLLAFSHCVAAVLRGSGKPVVPMLIMLIVWCGIRVLYITIAMKINHNIVLLFFAYPITWSISSVIYLCYYNFSDWTHGFEAKKPKAIKAE